MPRLKRIAFAPLALVFCVCCLVTPAHADLILTAAGVSAGFTLTPFVTGFPSTGYCCGPLGVAVNSAGNVMVQSWGDQTIKVFSDVNGQTVSSALSSVTYSNSSYGSALAYSNGNVYSTYAPANEVVQLNNDGTINQVITSGGKGGLWTNPANGHLLAAGYGAIYDIDPIAKTSRVVTYSDVDGVSVSPDGTIVYGAAYGHVYGWNIASGSLVFDSGYWGSSPDGTAIIQGAGPLAGSILANDNDGTVWLINPITAQLTEIAYGGSRGDYVGVDRLNGSLFLSQTDSLYRLTCGADCTFGPPPGVPEPSTIYLAVSGFALVGARVYRRRRRA